MKRNISELDELETQGVLYKLLEKLFEFEQESNKKVEILNQKTLKYEEVKFNKKFDLRGTIQELEKMYDFELNLTELPFY